MIDELPHPERIINAQTWLRRGCPHSRDSIEHIETLKELLEVLPSHHPVYCYGTLENKQAYEKLREQDVSDK